MKTTLQVPATAKAGDTIEIDVPGVIAEADAMPRAVVEGIIKDRLAQFAKGHVKIDGLDEAGKMALVKQLGIEVLEVDEKGEPTNVGKQLEAAKATWASQELTPALEIAKSLKAEVEGLRQGKLTDALVAAAAKAGVLSPLLTGERPPIAALVGSDAFAFDEKTRQWYVKGPNGFAISSQPTETKPYKTPDEFVAEWARKPENKPFVSAATQGGPGLQGGGSAGSDVVVLSKEQATDYTTYQEALKKVGGDHSRIRIQQQ